MAIRGKTFAVALFYTYNADQQGRDSQEKINNLVKNHKNCEKFHPQSFAVYACGIICMVIYM